MNQIKFVMLYNYLHGRAGITVYFLGDYGDLRSRRKLLNWFMDGFETTFAGRVFQSRIVLGKYGYMW